MARECQSVEASQFLKCKQCSLRRPRKRIHPRRRSGKFTVVETSPVTAPTASEKKLALPLPHTSSTDIAVTPIATDEACSSSGETKGLRLIDLDDLLASITRRANCNVCGSRLTVRESLKNRKGLCTQLTLSCTNLSCTGVEEALPYPCKHSKALNSRFILAGIQQ